MLHYSFIYFICSLIFSYFGYKIFIAFSKKIKLLDYPISRSAHKKAIPTGGGIVFSMVSIISSCFLLYSLPKNQINLIIISSLPITLLSFFDDFNNLKITYRLAAQIITSILLINLGNIFSYNLNLIDLFIFLFLILISTTTINTSNFMDGLDGLLVGSMLIIIPTSAIFLDLTYPIIFIILGSLLSFLIFNIYPAKLFMGDVGSIFLGSFYSGLAFQAQDVQSFVSIILLGTHLYADTLITIIRRFFNNENIFLAHKVHLFQRLKEAGWHQKKITTIYTFSTFIICFSLIKFGLLAEIISATIILFAGFYLDKKYAVNFKHK